MNSRQLFTALRRSAWKMKGRLLAAGLIMGSALAMFVGVYSAIDSLFDSRAAWYRELNVADLELRIVPEDTINIPSLQGLDGVASVEQRLVLPGNIDIPSGTKLYALMMATQGVPAINRLRIEEGRNIDPADPSSVVIERSMAQHHGYKVGDRFRLNIGKDHYDLTVRGIATSPEFLIDSANPNFFLPSKGSLGVVYVPYALVQPRLGYQLVNSLLVDVKDGADVSAVEQKVSAALGRKVTIDESLPLARQFGHLYLELDLGAFRIFVPAIVLIFVVTALVITVFLMVQWITEKKAEIGVMMALGYDTRHIMLAFAMPVLLIAAIALVSGTLLSFVMLYGFGTDYAKALGLPMPMLSLRIVPVMEGYVGMLAILAAATLLPLRSIMRLTPREAVRGNTQDTQAVSGRASRKLGGSVAWRYALRNLERGKALALMSTVAVALSLGAALSYFISLTSFEQSIVKRFAADDWDVAVDFLAPMWRDELQSLESAPGVARSDPYLRGPVKVQHGQAVEPSFLLGVDPATPVRSLRIIEGRALRKDDRGVIALERKTAATLGLKVGDQVEVLVRDKAWPVQVVGVFSGVMPGESYAPLADAQEWFDMADQVTGTFLKAQPQLQPDQLYRFDRVGRVTSKSRLIQEFVDHLKEIAGIVYLAFGFSLAVAVLFLFATTAYGVLRRLGEYSTLRTIGFADRTVLAMIVLEVALIGAAGAALAVAVGVGISHALNSVLSQAWFQVDTTVTVSNLLVVLLPALALFPLTALPPFRIIVRAGMVPTLRRRAFG
ncbi:ABC transporter permease [Azohydromonas aeria]|uniref:ABC transporter permease n=1 Tax=Azohydromonas aeria TaxID=2590212 RepID=UPI0012FADD31|nr:ABC transporter permease [Azohydromonas aeria]